MTGNFVELWVQLFSLCLRTVSALGSPYDYVVLCACVYCMGNTVSQHFQLKVPLPQVYVVELIESVDLCVERNIHDRKREEIEKVGTVTVSTVWTSLCLIVASL